MAPALPRVSVITIARNAAHLLPATVESVLVQTYGDLEYVVVDGASTDGTVDYLRALGGRVARWVSEPDGGIADAMDKGVRLSTGELFLHIHAGDVLASPDVVAQLASDYAADPWPWAVGGTQVVGEGGEEVSLLWPKAYSYRKLRVRNFIPHPATVMTREAYGAFGPFSAGFRIAMDYRLWLALGQVHPPRLLPVLVSRFALGGASSNTDAAYAEELRARREVPWGSPAWRLWERGAAWFYGPPGYRWLRRWVPRRLKGWLRPWVRMPGEYDAARPPGGGGAGGAAP